MTFDDIRDPAIEVCYNVTAVMGYDGVVMCPGIIDNYGPHVSGSLTPLISASALNRFLQGVLRA